MSLTRDQILKVQDLKIERVPVPEWGGEVYVRSLTGQERDEYEASVVSFSGLNTQKVDIRNLRARMASLAICDEEGNRLFEAKDILELSKKNSSALDRVMEVATRLSGMRVTDLERMSKNSAATAPTEVSEDSASD